MANAIRDFKSDDVTVSNTSGADDNPVFAPPGNETWVIQRFSRRLTVSTNPNNNVELTRRKSGGSPVDDELLFDYGNNPTIDPTPIIVDDMQGIVLEPGDSIRFKDTGTTGALTFRAFIDFIRLVPSS